jgi:hypothetical protein
MHPTPGRAPGLAWWESAHALRAVRQFAWLGVGSGKMALSQPTHQQVTPAVRRARILAAVYSRSVLRFADVLSLLGERLKVLHVL